ncbi:uncharacterized protein EI90DRAFT_3069926 [Cantharellus anzutake]|uniref:uncharacterized protein n=1 Tax=Cantharellus anzutake TaxID=1750568 RepID=UPI0019085CE4|nr:uncharacterized protein EI90DRAFT_3069926 [Cantharellus anzutake]KAF8326614.1 hypothetical protein EI90DRAFT_3069926 [Cantharellus anzutake]
MGRLFLIFATLLAGFLGLVRCDKDITIYADNQALEYRSPYARPTDWYNQDYRCGIPIKETHEQSATVTFTFNGTSAQAWLLSANTTSNVDFYIDGIYEGTMDTWSNTSNTSCFYKHWNSPKLPVGEHTITVLHRNLNRSHPNLDFVKYTYVYSSAGKGGLSLGAIAGIVIGAIVGSILICILVVACWETCM